MVAEIGEIWNKARPKVMENVTGRGVWQALNTARPVTLEGDVYVLGVPLGTGDLIGHLRIPATQRIIEREIRAALGRDVTLKIIDGDTAEDWDIAKRRDAERRRLQEAQMAKLKAELESRTSWDSVYESLARRFAAVTNKSLPQNRARFYEEALEIVIEARGAIQIYDEMQERNFARVIERVAQYTEIPSTLVARDVLKGAGEL